MSEKSVNVMRGRKGFFPTPIAERFWAKVEKGPGCWRWLGSTRSKKRLYGIIWVDGRKRPASQVVWELTHGEPFPVGMYACHKCDNPICVRPDHIFPGTPRDNAIDAESKGRLVHKSIRPTHCIRGHEFSGNNVIQHPDGTRRCKACKTMHNHARYDPAVRALLAPGGGE